MTIMSEKIAEVVKNNLPESVAGEMKTYLDRAEVAIKTVETQRDQITKLNASIEDLRTKICAQEVQDSQYRAVQEQLKDLAARELALIHSTAKNVGEVAVAEKNAMLLTMTLFLKNQEIRTSVQRNVGIPVTGMPGGSNGYSGSPGFVLPQVETETTVKAHE